MRLVLTCFLLCMYLVVMSTTGRGRPRNNVVVIDTEAKRIGSLLKYLRTERGVTQSEVAKKVDINQATYARYESGACRIPTHRLLIDIVSTINALAADGSMRMPPAESIALPQSFELIAA